MGAQKKSNIPDDKLDLYDKLIKTNDASTWKLMYHGAQIAGLQRLSARRNSFSPQETICLPSEVDNLECHASVMRIVMNGGK